MFCKRFTQLAAAVRVRHSAGGYVRKNLAPGYHVFSVLGTDAQGNLRTSNPASVVLRGKVVR